MILLFLVTHICSKTIIQYPELENRQDSEVCKEYKRNFVWEKKPCYTPSKETCVYGTQSKEDREMATKRVNFYRKLTGLSTIPQTTVVEYQNRTDQAALIMEVNHFFGHYFPEDLKCRSETGNWGVVGGNLYQYSDYACSTDSIEAYVKDENTWSLGHRRWVLDPPLSQVATSACGHYSVMLNSVWITKAYNNIIPTFLAYPPPGPVPYQVIYNDWSFSRHYEKVDDVEHNGMPDDVEVTVKINGGRTMKVRHDFLRSDRYNYPGAIRFAMGTMEAGEFYTVNISSKAEDTEWIYSVTAVDCENVVIDDDDDDEEGGDGGDGDNNTNKNKKKLSSGAIAGIVIAVVLVVSAGVAGAVIFIKKKKEERALSSAEDYIPKL